ncbi:MAG: PrsW family intramembrane metalloprotease [Acidobacteriota bacterium]|nr:MAG: PrsW family intramembrane metalloprotease [Acidobacteriota bacterium]
MKLTLLIESGSLAGKRFELETGFMTVGRSETCSVRFDPMTERIASKQHAFIEARADGFYISDNSSTNGTYVNDARVTQMKLSNGDRIQFGHNGTSAEVTIEDDARSVLTADVSRRDAEIQAFNDTAAAEPADLQSSLHNFGLGGTAVKVETGSKTGRYIGIGITLFAIAFLGLIVAAILLLSVGIVPAVIASVVAFVPAMFYLLPLMWLDRYDPEPLWLLALAFLWGALVAVLVSFVVNTGVGVGIAVAVGGQEGMILGDVVGAVISAPVVEELSKGVGLLILLFFFRSYFDDILDGIVFAGVIALGFATVENVLYYGRALGTGGLGGLVVLFFLRGVLSPFAHVTFTAMTGIGCGIARETHNTLVKIIMPVVGYFFAVLLHAIWNGMAVAGGLEGFLLGYLLLEIPFFLIFVIFALLIMRRQNKILNEMLAIDIARGLIPTEHAKIVTSAFRSTGWLLSGLFSGKFRARNRYVRAVGKLGLSYWHIQRANAAQGQTGSFQQNPILREEVLEWRDKV